MKPDELASGGYLSKNVLFPDKGDDAIEELVLLGEPKIDAISIEEFFERITEFLKGLEQKDVVTVTIAEEEI